MRTKPRSDNYLEIGVGGPENGKNLKSISIGHTEVEDNEVHGLPPKDRDAFAA